MKLKKLASLLLAAVLVLSLAVPSLAADQTVNQIDDMTAENSEFDSGDVKVPTIKITVPGNGNVIVNPYRMTVAIDRANQGIMGDKDEVNDQIIFVPQFLTNESDIPVQVTLSVKPTIQSTYTLAAAPIAATVTAKQMFVYIEAKLVADNTSTPAWAGVYNAKAAVANGQAVLNATTDATVKLTIPAKDDDGAKYAAYSLFGGCTTAPATAWTKDDSLTVTVAYSFQTLANDAA